MSQTQAKEGRKDTRKATHTHWWWWWCRHRPAFFSGGQMCLSEADKSASQMPWSQDVAAKDRSSQYNGTTETRVVCKRFGTTTLHGIDIASARQSRSAPWQRAVLLWLSHHRCPQRVDLCISVPPQAAALRVSLHFWAGF